MRLHIFQDPSVSSMRSSGNIYDMVLQDLVDYNYIATRGTSTLPILSLAGGSICRKFFERV